MSAADETGPSFPGTTADLQRPLLTPEALADGTHRVADIENSDGEIIEG